MTTTTARTPATVGRGEAQFQRARGPALVEVVSGPHTIVALGEDCLVCEEGLEPGQVYVFCRDASRAGVAHESCADGPARRCDGES